MAICNFTKGDHVIYASNGVCAIEDVKSISFVRGEPEKTYYILRPQNDRNSTIYIPEDNEILIGKIRAILSSDEITKAIDEADKSPFEWIEDRKQRALRYKELLSAPHPTVLLPAIKLIIKKHSELAEAGKKLCAIDKDTYEAALRFVKEEFTFSLGNSEKAQEYIEKAIGALASI